MWCAGRARSAEPATHRSSSSAMSRTRLERLIEQGDVPFITQPATRASDLDQIAGHAQGIMLRCVPRYARSIGAMKAANSIVADRKRTKASQMPKIVNLALQGDGGHGAFTWGMLDRLLENSRAGHFLPIDPQCPWATRSAVICRGCGTRKRPGINPGPSSFRLRVA
jgi:hypothetical protein